MIKILPYQLKNAEFTAWDPIYLKVAKQLIQLITTNTIEVIHFGSTSAMVGGKGIIDLSVLYRAGELEQAVAHLRQLGFQDQHSMRPFPATRPRKDGAVEIEGKSYLIHAHVIEKDSHEHQQQIQFREYLLANPQARQSYETKKKTILANGIHHLDDYGQQKSPHVKSVLNDLSPHSK